MLFVASILLFVLLFSFSFDGFVWLCVSSIPVSLFVCIVCLLSRHWTFLQYDPSPTDLHVFHDIGDVRQFVFVIF